MTLARIIWNNARQRRLSTILTSLSVAIGVGLVIAILTIEKQSQERLTLGYSGVDLVVGAKGSPLQLVLNVIYNLDASPGNVPYSLLEQMEKDPRVSAAAPYSVGDNYKGFRIVGTSDTYFTKFKPRSDQGYEFAEGRVFEFHEADLRAAMHDAILRGRAGNTPPTHSSYTPKFEAVIGADAARECELKVGDKFVATHGLQKTDEGEEHKDNPWTVVGILKPTRTPADRAIYINLDSFYDITGHVIDTKQQADKKDSDPDLGQISALAIKARSMFAVFSLRKDLNNRNDAQAAVPAEEIRKLMGIVGNVDRIILLQAMLIIVVSAVGTALAMFNSMNDRRRDIAVMRALGASRSHIRSVIIGEALFISLMGALLGVVLGHALVELVQPMVQAAVGFSVSGLHFQFFEIFVILGMLFVGVLSGIGPAISAYRTDVATGLSPH